MSVGRFDSVAPPPTLDPALKPVQLRASDNDQDEEERRRAGRGGGGINPANATHSLNIRPDVVAGPAGLEVRTTMKSEEYRAHPGNEADPAEVGREERQEPPRERSPDQETMQVDASRSPVDEFEADFAAAEAYAREDDPEREQATQRANEESAKRQNAERAARAGEDVPGEAASSEPDSFAADLRAAHVAAELDREGGVQEATKRDHGDTDLAPTTGGGRGLS